MALTLVAEPSVEPLELDDAKQQCRIDLSVEDDNEYIDWFLIPAARDRAEVATRRQLITATYDLRLDRFPCEDYIEIPKPPLLTVTSVSYVDTNGTTQTLTVTTDYLVDAPSGPRCARGRVALAYGKSWPTTRAQINAVTVRFTCGYGADGSYVPPLLKQAMLLDIGAMYAEREQDVFEKTAKVYARFKSWPTQQAA